MAEPIHFLVFAGVGAVLAEEVIDEVEILVSHENHIAAEAFSYFDQVSPAAGYDTPHTAEAA